MQIFSWLGGVVRMQACREPQQGSGKHSLGHSNIFAGLSGKTFLNFSFRNGAFWCTFLISERWWGLPNIAGPGVALPSTPPSQWACAYVFFSIFNFTAFRFFSGESNVTKWHICFLR